MSENAESSGVARKIQDLVDFDVAPEPDETRKTSDFNNKLSY